jgi:glycosyltransferase involved in cell wall biosynthesis
LAERLGIAARVTWLGALPRPAIEEVWPRLDCVAFPSRTTQRWVETVGRAALEAMARGLALVVSNSGVLPELVDDTGRVVPEDDVPALAEALRGLLEDPADCERLGGAARRRVMEEFSDAAVARKTLAFWQSLSNASS